MKKISEFIVKNKWLILIISLILLIPSIIGIKNTKINYDILVYLPEDIETMKGEKILTDDFNMGAFSLTMVENMDNKDVLELEDKIKNIDSVEKVISIDDLTGTGIPVSMLPSDITDKLSKDGSTLMLITFKNSTSNQETLDAVANIRSLTGNQAKVGGMSAMVLDTMNLSNKEVTAYVIIAVVLCIIVLMFCLDSYLVPILLLLNIGIAILYNMGSNIILGDISYITKAISAVLQLGVTTDFSIFLYHRYEKAKKEHDSKEHAMQIAITDTFVSVIGSSFTTIAGFLALCTMTLLLGKDIGLVMAKGVVFGVLCVLTLFPALILIFDKQIDKTVHKEWLPQFTGVKNFVIKHYKLILIVFLILCIPAYIGNKNVNVYYNLSKSLPDTLDFSIANKELEDKFGLVSPEMILVDKDMKNNDLNEMIDKIEKVDGIDYAISYSKISETGIPESMLNKDLLNNIKSDKYQIVIVNSKYQIATNELNNQITEVNDIVKSYDENSIVAGEGPLMKDMVNISNTDFNNVNYTSIIIIFIIMVFVLKSISLPIILVTAIEFAIFVNMASFYYTGVTLPFIASIIIGTIQLGATIDYAILMTTKYLDKRKTGADKFASMHYSLDNSVRSIFTSGLCFFAATFGVGLYSKIDMIGAICHLIARGALISMAVVILILPSLLILLDPIIIKTTKGFKKGNNKMKKNNKNIALALICLCAVIPMSVGATSKNETVYERMDTDGNVIETVVTDELQDVSGDVVDESDLENILNINGNESYFKNDNNITWQSNGTNIYYQGTTTKKLPIDISIKYYLNDTETSIQELNGQSGHIKVQIDYKNLDKHGSLYTPFFVTMGTIMNNETNTNISINTGKIVSNGKQSVIVGLATPGLADSLNISELDKLNNITLEFDTTSFEQNDIYNVYSPKLIDTDDLKVFDKLDSIYKDVDTLSTSSTALVNGSKTLSSGMDKYSTNFKDYKTNMNSFNSGMNKANKSYSSINSGIIKINSGISELTSVAKSLSELKSGLDDATTKLNKLSAGVTQVESALTMLNSGNSTYGTIGLTNDAAGLSSYMSVLATSKGTTCDIKTGDIKTDDIKDCDPTLLGIYKDIVGKVQIISNLNNNLANIKAGIDQISTGLTTASSSIDLTTLNAKMKELTDGLTNLTSGSQDFSNGLSTLSSSSSKLSTATDSLYNASVELTDGTEELSTNLEKFDNEGIQKIASYVNGDLKNLQTNLKSLEQLGNDYDTFTKKNSKMSGDTKFIVKIEANKN